MAVCQRLTCFKPQDNFLNRADFMAAPDQDYITAMNQRASHFSLGGHTLGYGSTYVQHYPPKMSSKEQPSQSNPFRGNSLNTGKGSFATTNKTEYPKWDKVAPAQLDAQKLSELKKHHFKLGSYDPQSTLTTQQRHFDRKQISSDALKLQEESKLKMRAHYHDFKEQPFTNYLSTYSTQYLPKRADQSRTGKPAEIENGIVFGNHQLPLLTTSATSYPPKNLDLQIVRGPEHSALKLGGQTEPMQTINQIYYDRKGLAENKLNEETMKQLRQAHFTLGNMSNNYQTQSANYRKLASSSAFQVPTYESGTWVDQKAPFQATSTYKRELPPREVQPFQRASQLNQDKFALGNQGNFYQTEFNHHFTEKTSFLQKAQGMRKPDNLVIGTDAGYYDTEHKSNFIDHQHSEENRGAKIKALSKEDHFSIGGGGQIGMTVYMDEYRKDQHNKSKLFHKES